MILPNEFIFLSATIILCAVGLCGIVTGWVSSRLLNLRWTGRTWVADAVLVIGVYLALAVTFGRLTRGNGPGLGWLALGATVSVVLRHLRRRLSGDASTQPAP